MTDELSIRDRLQADLKSAMRDRDDTARDTIRYILSAIKNAEIDHRGELSPSDAIAVLQKQAKQRQEAIEQFRSGQRIDLAEREEAQLAILKRYLPAELSDDEVLSLTREVVAETGASSMKDMSKVMPVLMQRAAGRADGRRLSAAVKTVLSGS
jgi:uncharacterized protein YqeY